ncbi:MAG TPA: tRNA (adenosine(37)-N6)-threonylcarbamoyltransferase complex ATPase subunit type 1 TsaE [Patescibacteria group bacterium]|nr:tRNA (adenosine(37)-N6)-threonylcarbamoyltransferase complex ATPase subunit type 1 TsaE [Patescibacteria group bacterium]
MRIDLPDPAATAAFGARLASVLQPPMVIGLIGDLGAGKTALARALIQSLVPGTRVKSPTYALIESYDSPTMQIHHLDLYRLRHPAELAELGLADLLGPRAVILIEWPDKGGQETPARDVDVRISRVGDDARSVELVLRSRAGHALGERLSG